MNTQSELFIPKFYSKHFDFKEKDLNQLEFNFYYQQSEKDYGIFKSVRDFVAIVQKEFDLNVVISVRHEGNEIIQCFDLIHDGNRIMSIDAGMTKTSSIVADQLYLDKKAKVFNATTPLQLNHVARFPTTPYQYPSRNIVPINLDNIKTHFNTLIEKISSHTSAWLFLRREPNDIYGRGLKNRRIVNHLIAIIDNQPLLRIRTYH